MTAAAFEDVEPMAPAAQLAGIDWYGSFAGTTSYVPRPATEEALDALVRSTRLGNAPAVLIGAPGSGKTLLLRLLAARLGERFVPFYVPLATLPQSELCAFILGLLGRPIESPEFPEAEFLEYVFASRRAHGPLVLLIDDAGSMSPDAARGLAAMSAASHGALRLVFAVTDGAEADHLIRAVGPTLGALAHLGPMDAVETRDYVRHHVAQQVGLNAALRLAPELLDRIHRESEGVPGLVHLMSSMFPRALEAVSKHRSA